MRSSTSNGGASSSAAVYRPITRLLGVIATAIAMTAIGIQAPHDIASVKLTAGRRSYRFADVTQRVGIPVTRHRSWGATFLDYDDNGWPDALIGRHLARPWFLTNLAGSFARRRIDDLVNPPSDRTRYDRHSCAWGEANADGRLDLYCVSGAQRGKGRGPNQLLFQTRNGNLVNRAGEYGVTDVFGRGRSANWLDFNRDGRLDIFVGNEHRSSHPNVMFKRERRRHYSRASVGVAGEFATYTSSWADWTRDGRPDLLVLVRGRVGAVAYRNGGRSLRTVSIPGVTGRPWTSGAWGDYNGDGWPDLAAVSEKRLVVFRNDRRSFRRAYSLKLSQGQVAAWFDAENDGDLDLFLVQGSPRVTGGGNRPDLLVVRDRRGFRPVRREMWGGPSAGNGESVATADFDRDGRVDLLITNGSGKARGRVELLQNRTDAGHWAAVELSGGRRNPLALGARVHVRADGLSYWRQVTDGANFRSQSEVNPVHLGLARSRFARLRIVWPGGARSCLRVEAGTRVRIVRGDRSC